MKTTLTIMVDNFAQQRGTMAEHGFAVWITRGEEHTLFDTGGGMTLANNLQALNKDVHDLHRIILSHGHWDHSGGLKVVLNDRESREILAHPGIFTERYSIKKQETTPQYVDASLPFSRQELEQAGACFRLTREFAEVSPGFWFSGEIPRPQDWITSDSSLVFRQDNRYIPDHILDDVSLVLDTEKGPVVLFGCAHAGADTILDYLAVHTGYNSFHAVIGGMHLAKANEQRIAQIITCLEKYQVQQIVATHCTGFQAMAALYQHFRERFVFSTVGSIFCFSDRFKKEESHS
ncbi:beta-lactamase domain protein [Candidatus Vecturithrix granuli]|uniref:Beta-lactamase domain protein n=1 Tax=Vecturithrix granuli TaxID=1499967 RepID=A0A081BU41_VECG1|nr:beta-lactamase domain protein [Candidatus Vecturithrix granuli]